MEKMLRNKYGTIAGKVQTLPNGSYQISGNGVSSFKGGSPEYLEWREHMRKTAFAGGLMGVAGVAVGGDARKTQQTGI